MFTPDYLLLLNLSRFTSGDDNPSDCECDLLCFFCIIILQGLNLAVKVKLLNLRTQGFTKYFKKKA